MLFRWYWKREVKFIDAIDESYIEEIKGNTAGLIICDCALMNLAKFPYIYDLGLGWKEFTGLPFVFAVWLIQTALEEKFKKWFNDAKLLCD